MEFYADVVLPLQFQLHFVQVIAGVQALICLFLRKTICEHDSIKV